MERILIFTLAITMLTSGCDTRKRELELERRQAALDQREQQLLLRERTLQLQEEEWQKKKNQLDSISFLDSIPLVDTSYVVDPTLAGAWAVKMTCRETSCQGSAVGDTKTEHWDIRYQGNHVVAKAMEGNRLARVYSGQYNGNVLELIEHRDTSSLVYDIRMVVRLRLLNARTMEGQREIIRENDCKIVYALRMDKQ